jgi:ubiquinone/menaquinone biosynthesis C-methylase UbiE
MPKPAHQLWKKIPAGKTPGTTPVLSQFWKLLPRKGQVLEVGSGWGRIVFECLEREFDVIGIEINKGEVAALNKKIKALGLSNHAKNYCRNIVKSGFKSGSFDGVIMQGVLGALSKNDRPLAAREAYRVLKVGGYLHIAEFEIIINNEQASDRYQQDFKVTKEFGTLSIKDEHGRELYQTHNFNKEELSLLLKDAGFKLIKVSPRTFTSYHGKKKPGLLLIATKPGI